MLLASLKEQKEAGFRWLRFTPELEPRYRDERDRGLKTRARLVAVSALVISLLYAVLDMIMLPQGLAHQTMAVRLLLAFPFIALVLFLSYQPFSPKQFTRIYALSFLVGGLSVVIIIGLARLNGVPMPYDGILLILMFGFFVMGLPFRTVSVLSLMIIISYLSMEVAVGSDLSMVLSNSFFLLTANALGMVGSWLSEYRQRAHFLDRQMLELSRHEAVQESDRKSHLITVASHDLRQPLNVISLMLENLSAADLPPEQQGRVGKLKEAVNHFNGLLASLLDLSRIREGMVTPDYRSVDTRQVLEQVIHACREDAAEKQIRLEVAPTSVRSGVRVDPPLLYRILQNLVVNGIEHSGATVLRLSAEVRKGAVCLRVRDNGKGMDDAARTRVFQPFFRADGDAGSQRGLGLGLAIVKELSELMGGRCGLLSREGKGSCFWVEFPVANLPVATSSPATTTPRTAINGQHLLVVEDHEEARGWLCETLSNWGYRVKGVSSGQVALDYCQANAIDLLITDLHLPDMSGHDLVQQLKGRKAISGAVIITADTQNPQRFIHEERLWVLHKPLVSLRLRTAILQLTHAASQEKSDRLLRSGRGRAPG